MGRTAGFWAGQRQRSRSIRKAGARAGGFERPQGEFDALAQRYQATDYKGQIESERVMPTLELKRSTMSYTDTSAPLPSKRFYHVTAIP